MHRSRPAAAAACAALVALSTACASARPAALAPNDQPSTVRDAPAHAASADEPAPLVTDRPDFTESPLVVPARGVQLEMGDSYTRTPTGTQHALGEVLVRVGLHPRAELRVAGNSFVVARDGGARMRGRQDGSLGAKVTLLPERAGRSIVPAAAIIVQTSVPTGSATMRSNALSPEAKLALGWSLGERWGLSSNLNVARPADTGVRLMEYVGSLSLGREVSERVGAYAEVYGGGTSRGERSQFGNVGLTFAVAPLFQLDARAGTGVGASRGERFVGVGVSRRW